MDQTKLKGHMARHGDRQVDLANAMGISLSRLNAKINETSGAELTQTEIAFIATRYQLTPQEIDACFFAL